MLINVYIIKLIGTSLANSTQIEDLDFWSKTGRLMGLTWRKEYLDFVLVPVGFFILFAYHLFLLLRYLKYPHTTVIGYEHHNKRAWVDRMVQVEGRHKSMAISVITSQVSAATALSSISLVLCSLIGAWLGGNSAIITKSRIVYGDTSTSTASIKYIALLCCFMVAFGCFVQTAGFFVLANFLITTPDSDIPVLQIEKAVIRGSTFWSIGLRALYFAITFLMWIFGPIPMLVSSVITVAVLHHLDTNTTPLHQYQPSGTRHLMQKNGQGSSGIIAPER
ncbi:uncharacterized protein [Coffea arabica]